MSKLVDGKEYLDSLAALEKAAKAETKFFSSYGLPHERTSLSRRAEALVAEVKALRPPLSSTGLGPRWVGQRQQSSRRSSPTPRSSNYPSRPEPLKRPFQDCNIRTEVHMLRAAVPINEQFTSENTDGSLVEINDWPSYNHSSHGL